MPIGIKSGDQELPRTCTAQVGCLQGPGQRCHQFRLLMESGYWPESQPNVASWARSRLLGRTRERPQSDREPVIVSGACASGRSGRGGEDGQCGMSRLRAFWWERLGFWRCIQDTPTPSGPPEGCLCDVGRPLPDRTAEIGGGVSGLGTLLFVQCRSACLECERTQWVGLEAWRPRG
jgi:hypothetical protein